MKGYITQINVINKNSFDEKNFSLSSKDYRKLKMSTNSKPLSSLIQKSYQGKEIGSASYMKRSKYRFLKTVNLTDNFGISEESIEYCRPENIVYPQLGDILIAKDGGGDGLGESALYNLQNTDKTDSISAGVLGLRMNKENRYYLLGLIKSTHFKNFIDLNTPQGSTIRHSKKVSLNYPVPFPKDEKVQNLVSLITQNILDKEEQIKLKNKKIDELIEKELKSHQKIEIFEYKLPKISDIKNNLRLDSGLYCIYFKKIESLIKNYQDGFWYLLDKYKYSRGPNLAISVIGQSIYSDLPKKNFYKLITNTEFTDQRTIKCFRYLGNKQKLMILPKNTVMLSADGTVGRSIFFDDFGYTTTNYHPWILNKKKDNNKNIFESIFLSCFLSYLRKVGYYEKIKDKSNGGGIKLEHLKKNILIPNFKEIKQKEIAKEYYNPMEKNVDLHFENYLEKEQVRNANIGIFQLNMEIFSLRENLENLIDNIIKEKIIDIILNY